MKKTLRCMAYQEGGVFVAACLDLSLAAQGDTMQDAMAKLEEQIKDYLSEAYAEPAFTEHLLKRKAPASMWFKYLKIGVRNFFSANTGPGKLFREPCETVT
ncbi:MULTISPECIES: DUF1902 domain-containing protein [unclassified Atlantibacter]|uniref:DUF1902 domain-containing protein n=1 Tax=unclassified Atlantibacter TaxID=2649394 RepID=UPI0016068328|nr:MULTISPECIES: DUF1902 domain-containing protein [unclassified Atlantibacter]MBB3321337.1 putative RNase H-like HicB family nuclease [Atlantibacter sp. RC6]